MDMRSELRANVILTEIEGWFVKNFYNAKSDPSKLTDTEKKHLAKLRDRTTEPALVVDLKEADRLVRERLHRDPNTLPKVFRIILGEEFRMLRSPAAVALPPVSVALHPFKDAVKRSFLQAGRGDFLFDDLCFAILRYQFGVNHPSMLLKSKLKDWCLFGCNVPFEELPELTWTKIAQLSLDAIQKNYKDS